MYIRLFQGRTLGELYQDMENLRFAGYDTVTFKNYCDKEVLIVGY